MSEFIEKAQTMKDKAMDKIRMANDWMKQHPVETGALSMFAIMACEGIVYSMGYSRGCKDCARIVEVYNAGIEAEQKSK